MKGADLEDLMCGQISACILSDEVSLRRCLSPSLKAPTEATSSTLDTLPIPFQHCTERRFIYLLGDHQAECGSRFYYDDRHWSWIRGCLFQDPYKLGDIKVFQLYTHICSVTLGRGIGYPISNNCPPHPPTQTQRTDADDANIILGRERRPFCFLFPSLPIIGAIVLSSEKDPVFVTCGFANVICFLWWFAKRPALTIPPTRKKNVGLFDYYGICLLYYVK
ncbi:hypothetical protein CEXT_276101 [Caerostris extrusa]|uniref:Uncharacterized protein n=1 Tax=Caerostris extrusa TaxID=172846 RepID=A0AAV4WUT7_CAEEX|nr:hypothetical protein CEXT_276101 [Caerostris extrusa]